MEKLEIDSTDRGILHILQEDADMSYQNISKKLFISVGTVHLRVKKLEKLGVIKRKKIEIDYQKLGYDITCFIGVYLNSSDLYDRVAKALIAIPEIVGINYTTGNYSMFLKIYCKDTNHLREILHDKIQRIDGIQRTETLISLYESVNRNLNLETITKPKK